MSASGPSLVVVYDLGSGRPERVAEFRRTPRGDVALTVIEPPGCLLARRWYDNGIEILGQHRRVLRTDGAAFMRALLQPFSMSYYRFIDESMREGDGARQDAVDSAPIPVDTEQRPHHGAQ
ncbi:hypothetical protein AB0E01_42450 [Nocardia vinacea]|uniref:hypothetical protein n=1 Tax=Nocardia vinacea TaxID=96468 RepID=UPI0033FAA579